MKAVDFNQPLSFFYLCRICFLFDVNLLYSRDIIHIEHLQ